MLQREPNIGMKNFCRYTLRADEALDESCLLFKCSGGQTYDLLHLFHPRPNPFQPRNKHKREKSILFAGVVQPKADKLKTLLEILLPSRQRSRPSNQREDKADKR